ncbi:MAG TPA: beta-ribofuranosylaminobenzene 5'-phosphate synthase family protein [Burkholderiaceae bacterium]|nr:beta-ribofuranosylaminobenzene 5'-phosphate synthase family protein [Burkholderiaceae bacterium]
MSLVLPSTYRMRIDTEQTLTLRAPGRLHLGFLDPSASLGRRYGSVGLVVEGFETEVELSAALAERITADTPDGNAQLERAGACLNILRARTGHYGALHLRLLRVLPPHAGFGSGTQLALAIGRAFARWHRLDTSTATLAHWLGRGRRSGIGLHGFDHGGLLVDGGPGDDDQPAPLLARIALPDAWRIVVVQDPRERGLAGHAEADAMAALVPMPAERAAEICHETLMRVLPGAAEARFERFAAGVTRIQQLLGAHYAPAQHGRPYTSAAVGRLLRAFADAALIDAPVAIGQSSWGPTGFAIVASSAHALALEAHAQRAGLIEPGLVLRTVAARNRGAEIVDARPR